MTWGDCNSWTSAFLWKALSFLPCKVMAALSWMQHPRANDYETDVVIVVTPLQQAKCQFICSIISDRLWLPSICSRSESHRKYHTRIGIVNH